MNHDNCWGECEKCPGTRAACMNDCDREVIKCARNLSWNPQEWARPPTTAIAQQAMSMKAWTIILYTTRAMKYAVREGLAQDTAWAIP